MKNRLKKAMALVLTAVFILTQVSHVYGHNITAQGRTDTSLNLLAEATSVNKDKGVEENQPTEIVPGKVMVKYKEEILSSEKNGLGAFVFSVTEEPNKKLDIVELEIAGDADVMETVEILNNDPNVEFAEPVYERRAVFDSSAGDLIHNITVIQALNDQENEPYTVVDAVYCEDEYYRKGWQWGLQAVNMDRLWGMVDAEYQSDITIAVVDSGVDVDHPEFEDRIVGGYDFINNDNNPDDDYGHGTHVAGIAAARNNDFGMAGVAPEVKIMPVKVLDENGLGDTVSVVNGIIYAVNEGADVINLSIGGSYGSRSELMAIQYALNHGVVVIAAAGNAGNGYLLDYPANYDGVISVGAVDWDEEFSMANFSNYGNHIDIVAPGVDILSTIPQELDTLNHMGDSVQDGYTLMSGTSMSTPFVSGMSAMLLAYCRQTGVSLEVGSYGINDVILQMLQASAYEFSDNSLDYSLVNGSMNEGLTNPPFISRQLQLTATAADGDTVELSVKGTHNRNALSNTLEGTFTAYMIPYQLNAYGYMQYGSYEEVGEITMEDGTGNLVVEHQGSSNCLFFVEGNDDYLSSTIVKPEWTNNSFANAYVIEPGNSATGVFNGTLIEHYYKFTTLPGDEAEYRIYSKGDMDVVGYLYGESDFSYELIEYNDDGAVGRNFMITQTLAANTTYYVKVNPYSENYTGEYSIFVERSSANDSERIEVTGTISMPEGVGADEDITGDIYIIGRVWSELYGTYFSVSVSRQGFTIAEGTESQDYVIEIPLDFIGEAYFDIGYFTDIGVLGYELDLEGNSEYVPVAYYGSEGMVTDIYLAESLAASQEADLVILEKASVESPERAFDTIETAGELNLGESITEKTEYMFDTDYYHFVVSDPGYYMLDVELELLDILFGLYGFEVIYMDATGDELRLDAGELIYVGDKLKGASYIKEFPAGEYYVSVRSTGEALMFGGQPDYRNYVLSLNKAAQITGNIKIPEGFSSLSNDLAMGLYNPEGKSYLSASALRGYRGLSAFERTEMAYDPLSLEREFSMFVPHDPQAEYLLGYYLNSNVIYSETGYYACEDVAGTKIAYTVEDMAEATPISAEDDSAIAFEMEIIPDTRNNDMESAFPLVPDTPMQGIINQAGDMDCFKIDAKAAGSYQIHYKSSLSVREVNGIIPDVRNYNLGLFFYEDGKWVQYAEGIQGSVTKFLSKGEHYLMVGGNGIIANPTAITGPSVIAMPSGALGPYELVLNCSPYAENVRITGTPTVGRTLTGEYDYQDEDGDMEGNSLYRWLRADSKNGNYSTIAGAVSKTYTLTAADKNKYIRFEVTPVATQEPNRGEPVLSGATGPVKTDSGSGGSGSSGGGSPVYFKNTDDIESTASGSAVFTKQENGTTHAAIEVDPSKIEAMVQAQDKTPVKIDVKTETEAENIEINIPNSILSQASSLQKNVTIESNHVSFEIEPDTFDLNATAEALRIQVTELTLDAVPEAERNKDPQTDEMSMVFDIGMYLGNTRITDFNKPVTVTVSFDVTKVTDATRLGVYYFNEEDNQWEYVGGKVNADGTVTFMVDHFSKYAVMEYFKTFIDITDHWAKSDIEIIIARHITKGVDSKHFKPDLSITRAEFVTMLVRALRLETTSDKVFSDVPENEWFTESIQKAYAAGIISDNGSNRFAPSAFITREQMAEMLVNAYVFASGRDVGGMRTSQQIRFKDEGLADGSKKDSIILANALELMIGNPDGTFAPKGNATRAQTAVTIRRLLSKLNQISE